MFASLLQGEDVDTGAILPGFEARRDHVSMTEKVRIKSIVENARIIVVEAQDQESGDMDDDDDDGDADADAFEDVQTGGFGGSSGDYGIDDYVEGPGRWEMESARVYERTIQLLGDELGKQEKI